MSDGTNNCELTEEEKRMFESCLYLATKFIEDHMSGTALEYMKAREKVSDLGLDEKYRKWFFNEA